MKNPKLSYIIVYIAEISIGLLLLLFTNRIFNYMSVLIGSVIILFGTVKLALSIKFQQSNQKTLTNYLALILGIILIFAGIFILIMRKTVVSILPILFGAYIILGAVLDLKSSLYLKKVKLTKWWIFLISIGILILGGILTIINPWQNTFVNNQIIGVMMIVKGINDIVILMLSYIGNKEDIEKIEGNDSNSTTVDSTAVELPFKDNEEVEFEEERKDQEMI